MKKILVFVCACLSAAVGAQPNPQAAVAAEEAGDFKRAHAIFLALAEAGDGRAMLDVGRFYCDGKGVPKDYAKAMEWWVRAFEKDEGMAYNNIAVLYRDGLGVEKNLKIAWGLLFIGHMRGLGGQDTVMLINHNLRKLVDIVAKEDMHEACRWSEEYFKTFVKRRGAKPEDYEHLKHSRDHAPVLLLATL